MTKLNSKTLDLLESKLLDDMLADEQTLSASVMEIFRRILHENGRLTSKVEHFQGDDLAEDEDSPYYSNTVPFPTQKEK